jgi:hypothetical protein
MAMFKLDQSFLEEVGLDDMPEVFRKPFLQHVYDQLQARTGESMSEGLNDNQLAEFEAIIDGRTDVIDSWLAQYAPNFAEDPIYQRMLKALGDIEGVAVKDEYASTKWLEVNRPDYQLVVERLVNELRGEIVHHRKEILLATEPSAQTPTKDAPVSENHSN